MIKLAEQGTYKIVETWGETRLIVLNETNCFAWVYAGDEIGEILVATKKKFSDQYTLARGKYRLYEVDQENGLSKGEHLELYIGEGFWQGYILPTGFPKGRNVRNKIIPTRQIITEASRLRLLN